jgi:hypothetical protein
VSSNLPLTEPEAVGFKGNGQRKEFPAPLDNNFLASSVSLPPTHSYPSACDSGMFVE